MRHKSQSVIRVFVLFTARHLVHLHLVPVLPRRVLVGLFPHPHFGVEGRLVLDNADQEAAQGLSAARGAVDDVEQECPQE